MAVVSAKRTLTVRREVFPIRGTFRISRGAKTEAHVVVAEIEDGGVVGRGYLELTGYGSRLRL